MTGDPLRVLQGFPHLGVGVIGGALLDSYLRGTATRLGREAPVPVLRIASRTDAPGGAGNAAANAAAMGGRVRLLAVVGNDHEGAVLRRTLQERGVPDDDLVVDPARPTPAKNRLVADDQIIARFDREDEGAIDRGAEERVAERVHDLFASCDAVIVSDYADGVLTPRVIAAVREAQGHHRRVLVVDAKDPERFRDVGATVGKPNYEEAVALVGESPLEDGEDRVAHVEGRSEALLDAAGTDLLAVTIDRDGALLLERGAAPYRTYARPTAHSRAAGAGDTFTAALALALAADAAPPLAAEIASAAAGVVVGRPGTVPCSGDDLRSCFAAEGKHVHSLARLAQSIESHRRRGERVVFTNGCFDILHRGHVVYLNRAKTLGDVLVVGVNSDESVRRLKGEDRPINRLEDRVQVLAALGAIDYLIAFDDDTPSEIIRWIAPDVFVKGGDYTPSMLPEAPLIESLGGIVQILPYVEDRSTTGIIERIRGEPAPAGGERGA